MWNFDSVRSGLRFLVRKSANAKRCTAFRFELSLESRELFRLIACDEPGVPVAAYRLRHRCNSPNHQRNTQRSAMKEIRRITPEHECVDTRNGHRGCRVACECHVQCLGKPRRVEHRGN